MESLLAYIPTDRRHALARGVDLPDRTSGAALFADISGFTSLTEALVRTLGPQRGADELPRQLNRIYDALIAEVNQYQGSVLGFSGDAITCWFDENDERGTMNEEDSLHRSSFRVRHFPLRLSRAAASSYPRLPNGPQPLDSPARSP